MEVKNKSTNCQFFVKNIQGLGTAQLPFWVPGLVPGPWLGPWPLGSLAQCMHKSVVHAQECCACTRILCIYLYIHYTRIIICLAPKQLLYTYNDLFCSNTAPEQRWTFLLTSVLHSRPRRIQWRIVILLAKKSSFFTLFHFSAPNRPIFARQKHDMFHNS